MMWTVLATLLYTMTTGTEKILNSSATMSPEVSSLTIMILIVMFLVMKMSSKESNSTDKKSEGVMMCVVGMLVLTSMFLDSPLSFLIEMELTIMPLAYLILKTSKEKEKLESLKFMVMMNTAGSIPFMVFISSQEGFGQTASSTMLVQSEMMMTALMMLFIVKTPMFITHLWLTKVHVSASGCCSMILASIMIKMGGMGMVKFCMGFSKEKMFYLIMSLCLVGGMFMTLVMARYFDSKTLIATSSVLHMCGIVPMIILKKELSVLSALMMMTAHGLVSYMLFYLLTIKYEMKESRVSMMLKSTESSSKMLAVLIVVFLFMNLGVPPLMNFFSEVLYMSASLSMKTVTATMMIAMTMLAAVIFTMSMSTSMIYGKMTMKSDKSMSSSVSMKSIYYTMWAVLIIITA